VPGAAAGARAQQGGCGGHAAGCVCVCACVCVWVHVCGEGARATQRKTHESAAVAVLLRDGARSEQQTLRDTQDAHLHQPPVVSLVQKEPGLLALHPTHDTRQQHTQCRQRAVASSTHTRCQASDTERAPMLPLHTQLHKLKHPFPGPCPHNAPAQHPRQSARRAPRTPQAQPAGRPVAAGPWWPTQTCCCQAAAQSSSAHTVQTHTHTRCY
jgi:hypothetical protein